MRKTMLLLLAAMMLALAACGAKKEALPSPLDYIDSVTGIDLAAETGGLSDLGISEQEVVAQRGEPTFRGTLKGATSWRGEVILDYEDFTYNLNGGQVDGYSLKGDAATARQVKIGDDKSRIEAQYGKDYYVREMDQIRLMGYLDKQNGRVIEFLLENDRATVILVADFAMYES
jgi:hypothetical protein